jgi:predicted transcriptional regulator
MPSKKPIVSFRIRGDIKDALQKLANADRRSLSSYIELALEKHILTEQVDDQDSPGIRLRGARGKRVEGSGAAPGSGRKVGECDD